MTQSQLRKLLSDKIKDIGTQRKTAKFLGVTQALVNDMLHGKRGFGPKVLAKLGLKKVIEYKSK